MGDDTGDGARRGVAREGEAEVAGAPGMEEGAEAAVTAPRLCGQAGRDCVEALMAATTRGRFSGS